MKERPVDRERAVMTHYQAPQVSQPADSALDHPAQLVPPQLAPVLRGIAGLFRTQLWSVGKVASLETGVVAYLARYGGFYL
jgi:hypothetical protein